MSSWCALLLGGFILACPVAADATWSIVAVDGANREVGIAGASCFPGSYIIAGVVPGKGVLSAQGLTSLAARDRAIELVREGAHPAGILAAITSTAVDDAWFPARWLRQYGVASLRGAEAEAAAYTGPLALPWRGARQGPGVSVQGNVLRSAAVLDQSLAAFASATRKCGLPYSLLRALEAGSEAGGDRRCSPEQTALSAFLIVARPGDDADAPYLRLVSPDQPEGGANPVAVLDGLFREWVSLSGSEQLGCGS